MMRVLWEEWRGASAFSSVRVLPILALGTALALLVTQFQPGALFVVLVLGGLCGGVLSGTQRWNQVLGRDWVGLEHTSVFAYAGGKVAGLTLVVGAWSLFLLPPLLLVALPWGVPWPLVVDGLAWTLAAALGAQAVGHLVTWGTSEFQRVLGAILVFLWIAATIQVPDGAVFNPLWQVWHHFHDPETGFDFPAWGSVLAASAGLWAFILLILKKTEGR